MHTYVSSREYCVNISLHEYEEYMKSLELKRGNLPQRARQTQRGALPARS